jgi:hypothetical protein
MVVPLVTTTGLAADRGAAGDGQVIRFVTTDPQSTDLDHGEPGPGAGDVQVFSDQIIQGGRSVGYDAGECRLVVLTEQRLVAHCIATFVLPGGELGAQGVFQEDPSVGPTGFRWAVTGGTGRYGGATGEAVGRFVADTDDVRWTVRLRS